ncbi:hypothetical protein [Saccharothrix australiensis]|uniref:Uncharacterized protein n=1 Tax=Saccharothrix australiensis TaxID=2072 RepID=A0A495W0Z2_9PSEU|nr:hypothetical protein [Saccharothrix australiensis]RKT55342.1 hypothetical protein C8E97_4005 [Saccharothrix australiensis]
MTPPDLCVLDLVHELTAARAERRLVARDGDVETATLLGAWIDVLLDEWNRRDRGRRERCCPFGHRCAEEGQTPSGAGRAAGRREHDGTT